MKTRRTTPAEAAAYEALKANSQNFQEGMKQSNAFYENGSKFRDDAHYAAFDKAWKAWNEEFAAAGFFMSATTGQVRKVVAK